MSMIWRSFSRSVSRLESILICSRTEGERFCASSIRRTAFLPAVKFSSRNRLRSSIYPFLLFLPFLGGMPNSWVMVSRSSISDTAGLKMRAVSVDSSRSERSFLQRVVLPVPIPPVMTMNPFFSVMPYNRWLSASLCCRLRNRYRVSGVILKGFSCKPKWDAYICNLTVGSPTDRDG